MKQITVKDIIENNRYHTILLDACGVLYNDAGMFSGVKEAVSGFQENSNVFIVTNNTTLYTVGIREKLLKRGIDIPIQNIISSGAGLKYDPEINQLIKGKKAYRFGWPESANYIKDAGCAKVVDHPLDADVVVLLSTLKQDHEKGVGRLIDALKKSPETPIICANPDREVLQSDGSFRKVIGYYADIVKSEVKNPIYFVGKPHDNFSQTVGKILEAHQISLDRGVCFFDDNYKNVINLKSVLGISGCVVKETGLTKHINLEDLDQNKLTHCSFLPTLSFD